MNKIIMLYENFALERLLVEEDILKNVFKVEISKINYYLHEEDLKRNCSNISDQTKQNKARLLAKFFKKDSIHFFPINSIISYQIFT